MAVLAEIGTTRRVRLRPAPVVLPPGPVLLDPEAEQRRLDAYQAQFRFCRASPPTDRERMSLCLTPQGWLVVATEQPGRQEGVFYYVRRAYRPLPEGGWQGYLMDGGTTGLRANKRWGPVRPVCPTLIAPGDYAPAPTLSGFLREVYDDPDGSSGISPGVLPFEA